MPRILDVYLDSVIYLYESVEAAAAERDDSGGSGFLIGYPPEQPGDPTPVYAVSNLHVVETHPVVRVNDKLAGVKALPLTFANWVKHPDGDDVAVAPIELSNDLHRYSCSSVAVFVTDDFIAKHNLGPGDECFMLGRFMTHDGKQQNTPTARFGNVSMIGGELIKNPDTGHMQEAYLVEMHSLPGYGGFARLRLPLGRHGR